MLRHMLVRDPKKRYTIAQIKQHKWMQQGDGPPEPTAPISISGHDPQKGEFMEQILRGMHSIGFDHQKTLEVYTFRICIL